MRRLLLMGVLAACNAHPAKPVEMEGVREWQAGQWCEPGWPKVDVLLVIDDSASMADEAERLADNLERIAGAYVGSDVDFRIAATSTHVGGPDCAQGGRDGALVTTSCRERLGDFVRGPSLEAGAIDTREVCRSTCPLESVESAWVDRTHDDPVASLRCLGQVGIAGCSAEAPMAAALLALDQIQLRPDAALAVVLIGDEDDCSRPRDATEPLTQSCWEAGARCSGPACTLREGGPLLQLESFWARLESIEADKRAYGGRDEQSVFVTAVAGLPEGYPEQAQTFAACEGAAPTVRTLAAVEAFEPANSAAVSVCGDDWVLALASLPVERGFPPVWCPDVGPLEWGLDPQEACVATETRDGETRELPTCRDGEVNCVVWLLDEQIDPACSDQEQRAQIDVVRARDFSVPACVEVRCTHAD